MQRITLLIVCLLLSAVTYAGSFQEDFEHPTCEAGIRCWWWWLNSNVTKEAITRDLEAMHDKGFSGAMIFDAIDAELEGASGVAL